MVDSINKDSEQTYYALGEIEAGNQTAQKTKKAKKAETTEKPDNLAKETNKETFDKFKAWIEQILAELALEGAPTDLDLKKLTAIIQQLEAMLKDPKNPNARLTDPMFDLANNLLKSLAAKGFTGEGFIPIDDGPTNAQEAFKAWQTELNPQIENIKANFKFTELYSLNTVEALFALIAFGAIKSNLAILENLNKDFMNMEQIVSMINKALGAYTDSEVIKVEPLNNPPKSMADLPYDDQASFDEVKKAFKEAGIEVETIKGQDGIEYVVLSNGDKFPVYKYENGQMVKDKEGNPIIMDDPDIDQIFESIYRQEQAAILAELARRKDEVPPPSLQEVAKNYTKTAEFINQYVFNDEEDPSASVAAMRKVIEDINKAFADQSTNPQANVNAASGEVIKNSQAGFMDALVQARAMDPPPTDIIEALEKALTMINQAAEARGLKTGSTTDEEGNVIYDSASWSDEDSLNVAKDLINNDPDGKLGEYLQQAAGAAKNKVNNLSTQVRDQNNKYQSVMQESTTGLDIWNKLFKALIQAMR